MTRMRRVCKRAFDLGVTVPALIVPAPLLALLALLVRLKLGSPVLFGQVRLGLNGRPFTNLKFRTMTDARDAAGELLDDAERLTPLGRFLRNSSLDELPELFNVLRGEISLVGPRPLLPRYLDRYTPEQRRRHEVKPGLTGWAQVHGRNALTWEEKFELDIWYVDRQSIWLDIKILLLTVWVVLGRHGINTPGYTSAPYFLGTMSSAVPADKDSRAANVADDRPEPKT